MIQSLGNSLGKPVNELYLDMKRIPELVPVERVAYVHDVKLGSTKFDTGFITFYLKDINSTIVAARLFDVEDFMMSGVKVAAFKHKPVIFKCVAQEFRGALNLTIDGSAGIRVYDGEFDAQKFVGAVSYDFTLMRDYVAGCKLPDVKFLSDDGMLRVPTEWVRNPLESIGDGRIGAYARFVEIAFSCVAPFLNDDTKDDVVQAFLIAAQYYYKYLKEEQNVKMIGKLNAYKYFAQFNVAYADSDNLLLYQDVFSAVVGISKPMHLYSHLIKNAFDYAKQMLYLSIKYESQPVATQISVGGVDLSKY